MGVDGNVKVHALLMLMKYAAGVSGAAAGLMLATWRAR